VKIFSFTLCRPSVCLSRIHRVANSFSLLNVRHGKFCYSACIISTRHGFHNVVYMCSFSFFTGRICRRQLCRYCFYSRADFGVFAPQGRHVEAIQVKFGREKRTIGPLLPAKFDLDRSRGEGLRPPKLKNWNFTNIIAPKGRLPCTIFTKFTSFMRVLSLHNFAKFGCFTSINDKIINNLLRWGRFQPNFRRPLAAKLLMGPKNV